MANDDKKNTASDIQTEEEGLKEALTLVEKALEEAQAKIAMLESDLTIRDEKIDELEKALAAAPAESGSDDKPALTAKVGKAVYEFKYPKVNYKGKVLTPKEAVKDKEALEEFLEKGFCVKK